MRVLPIICAFPFTWFLPVAYGYAQTPSMDRPDGALAHGFLIPATATMVRAWDIPRSPYQFPAADTEASAQVRHGFDLFTRTFQALPHSACNTVTCSNCHLNAGQRERALPLTGVAIRYPEFNRRAGRMFTVEDRVTECLRRSIDARPDTAAQTGTAAALAAEVADLTAYVRWLARGYRTGDPLPWRSTNTIPAEHQLPVERLDTAEGRRLYGEKCTSCHGWDGQGVQIGDKKAGPLWGPESWNDGAGAARIYTLAGFIRYTMPYLDPGSLTDAEAQQIAAYIDTRSRPIYRGKSLDYPDGRVPPDALYYFSRGGK